MRSYRVAGDRPCQTYMGKHGVTYGAGASADTVGARHICMNVLPMPRERAKVHYRERIETIAYMLEGGCVVRFGDRMQPDVLVRQGDRAFVAADPPHAPCNESGAPCTWLVRARREATRTASFCCRSWTRCWRRDSRVQ